MNFAGNFDRKLQQTLNEEAPEYEWRRGWSADGERWKVDVAGLKKESPRVLVEVELRKDNPVENVVKIWRWAANEKSREHMLFIHAFSAVFVKVRKYAAPPNKVRQHDRAVFVGERMQADRQLGIDYKWLPMKFKPAVGRSNKQGGGAMHRAARNLGHEIAKLLHSKSKAKLR
jgi:hypothetical protein